MQGSKLAHISTHTRIRTDNAKASILTPLPYRFMTIWAVTFSSAPSFDFNVPRFERFSLSSWFDSISPSFLRSSPMLRPYNICKQHGPVSRGFMPRNHIQRKLYAVLSLVSDLMDCFFCSRRLQFRLNRREKGEVMKILYRQVRGAAEPCVIHPPLAIMRSRYEPSHANILVDPSGLPARPTFIPQS